MPQIRVADADEQVEEEEGKEQTFDHQEIFFLRFPFREQLVSLYPSETEAGYR